MECDKAPRAKKGQRPGLWQLRATTARGIAAGGEPPTQRRPVRSASRRNPPAPSAAPLSPPEPCAALERPARLPGSHFPPTRFAALGGQAGMEPSCSSRASLPPPLPAPASLPWLARRTVSLENAGRSPFPGQKLFLSTAFLSPAWNSSQKQNR
ncbi:PREDICTED: uncharacterized protein LOC101375139 [Odobenus rosmarus divergens]|uniref:Uncharacterized protein LOC101375139 n=1 Tax=Odobenus rosmarus divergens TaxID=9708 RepID=A0A9B0HB44_ODORO